MANIELKYGDSHFHFEFDEERFDVLAPAYRSLPLSDLELGRKLDEPIGARPLEETISPGEKILIVVPDATREVGCGQVVNILIRRLIANGSVPFDISIIFATGIHRVVTEEEKRSILTPFIAQRINTLDHRPRDISRIVRLGETSNRIPVELNSALVENQHIILVGGITFHYFAGFTGGRKMICPGLASSRTVSGTHKLAFDCETLSRREGVGSGRLDGNPVHEAFVEAAAKIDNIFNISTIVNDAGEILDLSCGELTLSHRAACDTYAVTNTVPVREKRRLVIVSGGGLPFDINMIQAHKALEAASHACADSGTIVFLAECRDGLGRQDFLKWFEAENSRELAVRLCEAYQVNGQTAWSMLRKAEQFDIRLVTDMHPGKAEQMRMRPFKGLSAALQGLDRIEKGYIMPAGSKIRVLADGE